MNFRYAANKREAAFTTFLLFSLLYFFAVQGLRYFMVLDLKAPIGAIAFDKGEYYAVTSRQTHKDPYRIKITKEQYEQFEFYEKVQFALVGVYVVIALKFRRYYYDRKNWIGIDGA